MKLAVYMEDHMIQLALTPEDNWEENILRNITASPKAVSIHRGEFYKTHRGHSVYDAAGTESVLLRIEDLPSDVTQPG